MMTPERMFEIDNIFNYHAPSAEMTAKFLVIRDAIIKTAYAIEEQCPPGADRTAAMRKLKEAHMTANAAIVLEGKSYK
jgi:hypothetical protein